MSDLVIAGMGVPPYSARGLTQTLEPIPQAAQLRRTVNGDLADVSDEAMRKYASTIAGSDQQPPALDQRWPGASVTVDCIAELCIAGTVEEPTEEATEPAFGRPFVPGSVRHESGFTFYRPRLQMRIAGFSESRDEFGARVDWTLVLEET